MIGYSLLTHTQSVSSTKLDVRYRRLYGYLLDDRLEAAQACGEQALDLAVEHSDQLVVKNCLFLLSEIAVRRGDTFRARRFLRELAAYYPEIGVSDELVDVFLQTDLTSVVNLRG